MPDEVKPQEKPGEQQAPAQTPPPQQKGLEEMIREKPELVKELYAKSPELFKDISPKTEEKPVEKKVEPPVADGQEEIALKLAEGMDEKDASLVEFKKIMGNKKLSSSEKAQAIVDMQASIAKKYREEQGVKLAAEEKALREAFGNDYDANIEISKKGLVYAEKAAPGFTKLLDETGLGKHPTVIRHLHQLGKATGEAQTPRPPSRPSAEAESEEAALRKRFPNSPSMFPQQPQ